MVPGIAKIFGSMPGPVGAVEMGLDEPMVDERLGSFQKISIPVRYGHPKSWQLAPSHKEYLIPQTDKEHLDLLNKYYAFRATDPMWKEHGRQAEQESPHFNDKDTTLRKNIDARSSWIEGVQYDPTNKRVYIDFGGGNVYEYGATPDQFRRFMSSGSLGAQISRIKNGTSQNLTRLSLGKKSRPKISKTFQR